MCEIPPWDSLMPSKPNGSSKNPLGQIAPEFSQDSDTSITMRTCTILRRALDIGRVTNTQLPPTFLLPLRVRLHQLAAASPTQFQNTPPEIQPHSTAPPESPTSTPHQLPISN